MVHGGTYRGQSSCELETRAADSGPENFRPFCRGWRREGVGLTLQLPEGFFRSAVLV